MKTLILTALTLAPLFALSSVQAHRSGCHRWHSCESDSGSYTCGDTGHSNYCDTPSSVAPAVVAQIKTAIVNEKQIAFREGATTKSKIFVRLNKGTVVIFDHCGLEWCAIAYGDKEGYMMKKFLNVQ